jgi:phosphoglycolate phosphatase-like HAD superfamily hydrolase
MLRLVLFDIDGTLIHTNGAGITAFDKVFETHFKVPHSTRGVNFAGRTDTSLAREVFGRHAIEPSRENFAVFFEQYAFWLAQLLLVSKGDIHPGVWRFIYELQRLPEPPAIGLLTGNIRLGAEIKLRHFNLWEFFMTGAFGDDSEDRRQIAAIARERGARLLNQNLAGDEILVIGDTPLDIDCARAIGAEVLAVATGDFTLADLEAHQPNWAVTSLEKVRAKEICRR